MLTISRQHKRFLEVFLVLVCLALGCLLYEVSGYKMVVLNLYYLPVVLAAFFLGRYRAGVLALLCVITALAVTVLDLANFAAFTSPIAVGLAVTIWGAVLGLNALLVGTLSDERSEKIEELKDAYVGVVEVLSRYLSSADSRLKDRSRRISELSEKVALRMKLPDKEVDDVRVAALLHEMENVEVTARVIRKAMGNLKYGNRDSVGEHTFYGSELVQSLGAVLSGALPLLLDQSDLPDLDSPGDDVSESAEAPLGAKVIQTVRSYDLLVHEAEGIATSQEAIHALRQDIVGEHHPAVVDALEHVVLDVPDTRRKSEQHLASQAAAGV